MAVAMIGRPSWPYRPARGPDPDDLALRDQAQGQGPAQALIGEMAWLLRDTRGGMLLGGSVLSAITIGIALEAAFSGRVIQPSVVGAVNVGLLDGQLAWRQHDGGHTDAPNWKYFIPWADKFLRHAGSASRL